MNHILHLLINIVDFYFDHNNNPLNYNEYDYLQICSFLKHLFHQSRFHSESLINEHIIFLDKRKTFFSNKLERYHHLLRSLRVTNYVRQRILVTLIPNLNLIGPRGGLRFLSTSQINNHVSDLLDSGILKYHSDFKTMCNDYVSTEKNRIMSRISNMLTKIENIDNLIQCFKIHFKTFFT